MISLIKSVFHGQSTDSVKFPEMDSYLKTLKKADLSRQNADLVSYDMFSADDPDKAIVDKKLAGEEPFSSSRENKAFGTFIGTAVGNALGVFTEGFKLDYDRKEVKDFEYKHSSIMKRSGPGHYTAGTSLALCLADSLLYKNFNYDGKDIRYRFLLWCYCGYNNGKSIEPNPALKISTGAGRSIFNSISEFVNDPTDKVSSYGKQTNDNGNGTLIRLAPLPIAFIDDMNKCLESAVEQSFTTHNGIEAAECCKLIAFVAWHFLSIESVGECKAFLEQLGSSFKTECVPVQCLAQSVQEDPSNLKLYHPAFNLSIEDRNWNWKNPEYKFSPCRSKLETALIGMYCMDATAMALHIIYHADSFQDAVLKAINLGGDSVSLGSIVGMLAGAMFGFDEDIKKMYLEHVSKWDHGKCALRAYKLIKPSEEKFKQATPTPEIIDKEKYVKPV